MSKAEVGMDLSKLREMLDENGLAPLPIAEDELCDRYERLYTGAVSDVLRERTLLDQALPNHILPLTMETKRAGIAFTIRSTVNPTVEGEMEIRAKMLDDMPRNCMVVWTASGDQESAHWGEVMTASAIVRGARGAVIDGGLRDTVQVLAQDFPVFYKYRTSNGSLGRCKMTDYQVPIKVGKVVIRPGDLVFGDVDGVLVVPRDIAYEVLLRAEAIKRNEVVIRSWVKDGFSAQQVIREGGYF